MKQSKLDLSASFHHKRKAKKGKITLRTRLETEPNVSHELKKTKTIWTKLSFHLSIFFAHLWYSNYDYIILFVIVSFLLRGMVIIDLVEIKMEKELCYWFVTILLQKLLLSKTTKGNFFLIEPIQRKRKGSLFQFVRKFFQKTNISVCVTGGKKC